MRTCLPFSGDQSNGGLAGAHRIAHRDTAGGFDGQDVLLPFDDVDGVDVLGDLVGPE